jgi:hypothetical protein
VAKCATKPPAVFDALRELSGRSAADRYGMTETLITVSTRAHGPAGPGTAERLAPLSVAGRRALGCDPPLTLMVAEFSTISLALA